jgi:hypothetical protein
MDGNEKIIAIFLNIAKTFNTIDDNELIKILPNYSKIN